MSTYRTPMISIQLADSGTVNQDVQLFRTGTFHHEQYGKFTIDSKMLSSMQANFQAKVRGVDIAIDYKHDSEDVAAGWIKEVYLSQDGEGLWAKVDWTPNGKKILGEKEFRYLSPEFVFEYQDNESLKKFGPVLLGAGLTNRPVIKKMEPVVELSEIQNPIMKKEVTKMDVSKVTPEMVDKMSPEEMKALCMELIKGKAEPEAAAPPVDSAEMTEMKEKLAAAEKQLMEYQEAKAASEKKAAFAVLLTEGKACKAQEQAYLDGDMTQFIQLASPLKLNEGKGTSVDAPQVTTIESSEQAQVEVLKLADEKAKDKKIGVAQAIKEVLAENPTLKTKIYG